MTIEDNGIGIAEDLPYLGALLPGQDRPDAKEAVWSLVIVKKLVQLRGKIDVASRLEGTTFTSTFPLLDQSG